MLGIIRRTGSGQQDGVVDPVAGVDGHGPMYGEHGRQEDRHPVEAGREGLEAGPVGVEGMSKPANGETSVSAGSLA